MGNAIKPGDMGSAAAVGMPPEFANSMAAAMEAEMNLLLPPERQFDPSDNSQAARDRRILFVAIARGIVKHLTANEDAFLIRNSTTNAVTNRKIDIQTDPPGL